MPDCPGHQDKKDEQQATRLILLGKIHPDRKQLPSFDEHSFLNFANDINQFEKNVHESIKDSVELPRASYQLGELASLGQAKQSFKLKRSAENSPSDEQLLSLKRRDS